ncbi:hypothetical protein SCE1572_28025 [Sorangium cellulosum So0157-2]|uniref:Uncharacterized protein n=1 Tax=Sorangium cellulosum So0157-2 TaxID=1254432 RepID=S4XZU1_SORCE|nr:hypothetical protein [Sorangium cellulosum]AGP37979.1 hypothetical protein SCE1572_28025 [Sorangium cellulosum So0157-2]
MAHWAAADPKPYPESCRTCAQREEPSSSTYTLMMAVPLSMAFLSASLG